MTGFRAAFQRTDGSCAVFSGEDAPLLLRPVNPDGTQQDYAGRRFSFTIIDDRGRVKSRVETAEITFLTDEVSGVEVSGFDLTTPGDVTEALLPEGKTEITFWGMLAEIINNRPRYFFKSPFKIERGPDDLGDADVSSGSDESGGSVIANFTVFSVTQPGAVFTVSFAGAQGARGESMEGIAVPAPTRVWWSQAAAAAAGGVKVFDWNVAKAWEVDLLADMSVREINTPPGQTMIISFREDGEVGFWDVELDPAWVIDPLDSPVFDTAPLRPFGIAITRAELDDDDPDLRTITGVHTVPDRSRDSDFALLSGANFSGAVVVSNPDGDAVLAVNDTSPGGEKALNQFMRNGTVRYELGIDGSQNFLIHALDVNGNFETTIATHTHLGSWDWSVWTTQTGRKKLASYPFNRGSSSLGTGGASVPGMTPTVHPGDTLGIEGVYQYTCASAGGVRFVLDGGATIASRDYTVEIYDYATNALIGLPKRITAAFNGGDAATFASATGTIAGEIRVKGQYTVGGTVDGGFGAKFAQAVDNATPSSLGYRTWQNVEKMA